MCTWVMILAVASVLVCVDGAPKTKLYMYVICVILDRRKTGPFKCSLSPLSPDYVRLG